MPPARMPAPGMRGKRKEYLPTLLPSRPAGNCSMHEKLCKAWAQPALLRSNEMKAEKIGRVLGTSVRVAGRMAGERIAGTPEQSAAQEPGRRPATPKISVTKRLARGAGGFLRPFARVGGVLWLEVTGVFFLLFALVFVRAIWQSRASAVHGPGHWKFVGSAAVVLLFLYLAATSFWRARRK